MRVVILLFRLLWFVLKMILALILSFVEFLKGRGKNDSGRQWWAEARHRRLWFIK